MTRATGVLNIRYWRKADFEHLFHLSQSL